MRNSLAALVVLCLCCLFCAAAQAQPPSPAQARSLSPEDRRELNVYFTSLVEARLPSFAEGRLPYEVMLEFALQHALAKYSDGLTHIRDGQFALVPANLVDRITEHVFGSTLNRHVRKEYPVHKWEPDALRFAQVRELRPLGGGRFRAEGVLYVAGLDEGVDPQAGPKEWEKAGQTVERAGTFAATLRRAGDGAEARYILIEYLMTAEKSAYVDDADFEQMMRDEGLNAPRKKRSPRPATSR